MSTADHPIETIVKVGLKRVLLWGAFLAVTGLLFRAPPPDDGLFSYSLIHLAALQVITFLFAIEVAPLTDNPWFPTTRRPWLASIASLVAAVVGYSALLTLAS